MDLQDFLGPGLAGGLSTVFFIWLVNRRGKDEAPRTKLRTGRGVFWFLVVFSPIIILIGVLGGHALLLGEDGSAPRPVLGIGLGLLLIGIGIGGLWQVWDARTRWASWDKAALTIHQKRGPEIRYVLRDISALRYIWWMQAWQIEFTDGQTFWFNEMMSGNKELLALCDAQLEQRG